MLEKTVEKFKSDCSRNQKKERGEKEQGYCKPHSSTRRAGKCKDSNSNKTSKGLMLFLFWLILSLLFLLYIFLHKIYIQFVFSLFRSYCKYFFLTISTLENTICNGCIIMEIKKAKIKFLCVLESIDYDCLS